MENILERVAGKLNMKIVEEAVDIKQIIKALMDTNFKGSNEEQMKGIQLLKGLATSEDELSNKFMAKLSDAYTKIGKEVLGSVEEGCDDNRDKDETDESFALRMQAKKQADRAVKKKKK